MKNILSYNCIRKPNIIQRNIIDCMELRSAEIRNHIVIRRTSRVYSLCVSFASFSTGILVGTESCPFLPLLPLSLSSPLHQINPHHVLYSHPRYMLYSNPRHMLYSNPRHMFYSNPCHMFIRILVTWYIIIHH